MLNLKKKKKNIRQTIASTGENEKKLDPSRIAGGKVKWRSFLENSLALPQIVRHRIPI